MKIRILSANDQLKILSIVILAVLLTGCVPVKYAHLAKDLKEAYPGQPEGYLTPFDIPNSKTLLPPPPQPGSAAYELDLKISEMYLQSDDTVRWKQARVDANLDFPVSIDTFAVVLDTEISLESAPYLYLILNRVVCNLHWHSDVVEGRHMGSATVAALHGNEKFMHDLKKAKKEVKKIRKKVNGN